MTSFTFAIKRKIGYRGTIRTFAVGYTCMVTVIAVTDFVQHVTYRTVTRVR